MGCSGYLAMQCISSRWIECGYLMVGGALYRYALNRKVEKAELVVPRGLIPKILYDYGDAPTAGNYGLCQSRRLRDTIGSVNATP